MKTSWALSNQQAGLIDKYINLWKTMGFDFNGDTSNSQKMEHGRFVKDMLGSAVRKISAELEGIEYNMHKALKIVHAKGKHCWIVKFNMSGFFHDDVKTVEAFISKGPRGYDLLEWRFKDGPPETPPPTFPCVEIPPLPETPPPPPRAEVCPFPVLCSRFTSDFSALSTSGTPSPILSDEECEFPVDKDDEDDFEFPVYEDEADGELAYC